MGIRGASITLPELKLRMPSIELPSLYRNFHPKKMSVQSSEAVFVPGSVNMRNANFQQIQTAQLQLLK